jgi:hypothetical protein
VCEAADDFSVGTPPEIMADSELLNAYLTGVEWGLKKAHDASPEGLQERLELEAAARLAEFERESAELEREFAELDWLLEPQQE